MKQAGMVPAASRAALYIRVSTGRQAREGVSLDAQDRACREFLAQNGLTVDPQHVYEEADSGGELFSRPALMQMLSAARRGEFGSVVCHCLDRFVRDDDYRGWLRTELRAVGVQLHFATETYEDTLEGGLKMSIKSLFAQEERRKISQRNRTVYEERLKQGRNPGIGPAPYGYLKEDGLLIIHEPEAEIVRRLFRWALEALSLSAMARRLNEEGIPPPSASPLKKYAIRCSLWHVATISGILRDPVYRGERAARRQRSIAVELDKAQHREGFHSDTVRRPAEEWRFVPAPAIVSAGEWHAAQEILDQRRGVDHTRNETRPALLRGLIGCAVCGRRMQPDWKAGNSLAYRCSSRSTPAGSCGAGSVLARDVEPWVQAEVTLFLQQPERIEQELQEFASTEADTDLEAELERQYRLQMAATRKQERLLSLFVGAAEGELPVAMIQRQIAEAEKEKEGLEAIIAAIKARQNQRLASREQGRQLAHYCRLVARRLGNADFKKWRLALDALGVKVYAAGLKKGGPPLEERIDVTLDRDAGAEGGVMTIGRRTRSGQSTRG